MSFLVEPGDGTAPLANSYTSVVEFRAYWNDREFKNFDHTQYSDAVVQRGLIKATDYIERKYRNRIRGLRLVNTDPPQPLSFPRYGLYVRCLPITGVPTQVKNATSEYAKRIMTTTPDLEPDAQGFDATTGQLIKATTKKVGPIEVINSFEAGSSAETRAYPAADELMEDFLYNAYGGVIRN